MLVVMGSKLSVLPRICEVEAVGMGATSRLLAMPNCTTSLRSWSKSKFLGLTPQRSNESLPSLAGEPLKLE